MSEIRATTISDAAGTGPITLTGQSAAKAWHSFDASSGSPVTGDSFNISSTTDGGTGIFTPSFTNNFANTQYSVGACASNGAASLTSYNLALNATNTNNFEVRNHRIVSNAVALYDSAYNTYTIHGDLA